VTSKSPVGDISVVTLIRTDTTLDHSQKAEKVWRDTIGATDEDDMPTQSDSFPRRADFWRMAIAQRLRMSALNQTPYIRWGGDPVRRRIEHSVDDQA
jgi:hypothetical protein